MATLPDREHCVQGARAQAPAPHALLVGARFWASPWLLCVGSPLPAVPTSTSLPWASSAPASGLAPGETGEIARGALSSCVGVAGLTVSELPVHGERMRYCVGGGRKHGRRQGCLQGRRDACLEASCVQGKSEGCLQGRRSAGRGGGMRAGQAVGCGQGTRDAGRGRQGRAARRGGDGGAPWLGPQPRPTLSDSASA